MQKSETLRKQTKPAAVMSPLAEDFKTAIQKINEVDKLLYLTRDLLEELLSSEAVTLSTLQIRTVLLNERLNKFLNERIPF